MRLRKTTILLTLLLVPLASAQPNILFEVDWDTATGTSSPALTDGGLINDYWPSGLRVRELTESNLDHWPDNGLEITFEGSTGPMAGIENGGAWDPLPVGDTIYYRLLMYYELPLDNGIFDHGLQTNTGAIAHTWDHEFSHSALGQTGFQLGFGSYSATPRIENWRVHNVPAYSPIRLEWAITRLPNIAGDAQGTVEIRVFDESNDINNPTWTESDFLELWGAGPRSIADLGPFNLGNPVDAFESYLFGASGSSGVDGCCLIVTGFAVSHDDWIGPYGGVSGCTDGATRSCGSDVGVCVSGTETCSGGVWGSCVGEVTSSTEVCDDTLDNDCDTTTDCLDSDCTSDPACIVSPICGDSNCDANETCSSCPGDCGACPTCGDSTCNGAETCLTCPGDCGTCGPTCGDSTCDAGESCSSCPGDCGSCSPPTNNPGDVNNDLMVDLDDLVMMTLNLGSSGFDPITDINSDGRVNIFDMVVVARNYGNDYSTPAPTGLVAYYDFNEGSGIVVTDLSGNGNDGSFVGSPSWVTGVTGTALSFDGTNDWVIIPDSSSLDITDEITLMAWINTPGNGYGNVISKDLVAPGYNFFLNSLSLEYNLGTYTQTPQVILGDTWTHIALTYDGSNVRIYRDSSLVATNPLTSSLNVNSESLYIGSSSTGSPFLGSIDDVRIYNRALTPAEIVTDMNS